MSGIIAQNVGANSGLVKAVAAGGGEWTLIQTITSDGSDATMSFTSGLDSTYDEYCFKFIGIHPETDGSDLQFNLSIDGGSNYNVTKTSTYFHAEHNESGTSDLGYYVSRDLAQSTAFQTLQQTVGSDNDQSASGYMYLYQPSSTTFVKHFISQISNYKDEDYNQNTFVTGYGNTTSAVDAIQFKMSDDEIQGGSISMYGIG